LGFPGLERLSLLSCQIVETLASHRLDHQFAERPDQCIDAVRPRMRQVIEALIALSPSSIGFTASDVTRTCRLTDPQSFCRASPRSV
jgi:hypothetical protein